MKLLIFFFLTILTSTYSQAQDVIYDESEYEYSEKTLESVSRFNLRNDFYHSIGKIHDPSTVSPLYFGYQFVNMGYQKKPFILDADIQFPIAIQGPSWLGLNVLHIIPRFKFRIFNNDEEYPYGEGDTSLPVRTPSAMPGIAYYWTPKDWWSMNNENSTSFLEDKYLGIYVYHHSNGQDGPELDLENIGEVNTYNGNFGEQLVFEFISGGRYIATSKSDGLFQTLSDKKKDGTILTRSTNDKKIEWYWRFSYEWHPKRLSNEIFDDLDLYGKNRVNISLTRIIHRKYLTEIFDKGMPYGLFPEKENEKWRHHLKLSYIIDKEYKRGDYINPEDVPFFNLDRRLNINYTLYYIPPASRLFALFGQIGYFGSDEYNIYFNNSYTNLRFGISFALFDQPKYSQIKRNNQ